MADQQTLPPVKGGLTPYLTVDGAIKAVEFYKKAFAAEVAMVQPPDEKGRTLHAHLYINGSSLMLSDAYPDQGHPDQRRAIDTAELPALAAAYRRQPGLRRVGD